MSVGVAPARGADRRFVDVDDRHEQRENERPDDEADHADRIHPADDGEEQRHRRQLRLAFHRPRAHHVVDERDDDGAPDDQEDGVPGLAGDEEVDDRRHPDGRGADHRHERDDGRHGPPEKRRRHAGDDEADGGGDALREAGEHVPAEGGVDDALELQRELAVVALRQRRQRGELGDDVLARGVEEVHRQQHEAEADDEAGQAADDRRAMPRHPSRQLAHNREDEALRTDAGRIEAGDEAAQEFEVMGEVEARQEDLRLAALHPLDEPVRLLHEEYGEEEEREGHDEGDADEHDDGGQAGAPAHPRPDADVGREGKGDEDGADEDRAQEWPDDPRRGPEHEEGDEAEEDDAGEPPLAPPLARVVTHDQPFYDPAAVKFIETPLPGVRLIEPDVVTDDRGFFMETYHLERFPEAGIDAPFVQDNHSRSARGVLRGLHYQEPNPQGKLVRCTRGALFDVAVDIRTGSPTFGRWYGTELTESNRRLLWIPPGFAHGFCALADDSDLVYKCTAPYSREHD